MSVDCFGRVHGQEHTFAFMMVDLGRLREIIPACSIDAIQELELPGLAYHHDHNQSERDEIAMQICEGFLVAAHQDSDQSKCMTKTIFERFVQRPPALHLECVQPVKDQARTFLNRLGSNGDPKVYAILSWPTMKNVVYGIAEDSHPDYIGSLLRKQSKDDFVKMYWVKAILGNNLCGWEDAVKTPPEQVKLNEFLSATTAILERDAKDCDDKEKKTIHEELDKITGDNCKSYVRPQLQELANGFVGVFEKQNRLLPKDNYIFVEHYLWNAVKTKRRDWWKREMDGVEPLCLFNGSRIFLVTTNSGRGIIVVPSFFLAFSPEPCRVKVRLDLIQSLIALLELLGELGVHDTDYVASFRKVLVSYHMALEKNDDNEDQQNRWSARRTMPVGYMMQPMERCITVASGMGVNVHHHFYLQFRLDKQKFRRLLQHMDMLTDADVYEDLWPSHPDWKCPGALATNTIAAEPCGGNDSSAVMMGGNLGRDKHLFYGRFVCTTCSRKFQRRERDVLESLPTEQLTHGLATRKEALRGMTRTAQRNQQMETQGREIVLEQETARSRANPRRDEAQRRVYNQKRDANRKRSSGECRNVGKTKNAIPYPPRWMTVFEEAILEFFKRTNMVEDKWFNIRALLTTILDVHWDKLPKAYQDDGRTKKGLVKYREDQLKAAARKYLVDPGEGKKVWKLKTAGPNESYRGRKASGKKYQTIYDEIAAAIEFDP